jgi:apolipoprotein D and lipocalin family protein
MGRMPPRIPALSLTFFAFFGLALLGPALAEARTAPEPASKVDLSRLAGRWYLIARLPGRTGKPDFGAQVEYKVREHVVGQAYTAHTGSLSGPLEQESVEARADGDEPGRWRIQQGWFGGKDRLVLYVSAGYRRAIIADPERENAWLLAREPEIPEWSYAGLLARLAAQGYDVSKLRRVVQKPEQVGKSGFEP